MLKHPVYRTSAAERFSLVLRFHNANTAYYHCITVAENDNVVYQCLRVTKAACDAHAHNIYIRSAVLFLHSGQAYIVYRTASFWTLFLMKTGQPDRDGPPSEFHGFRQISEIQCTSNRTQNNVQRLCIHISRYGMKIAALPDSRTTS